MIMKRLLLALLFFMSMCQTAFSQVGTWKAYMAYKDVSDVIKIGNYLYVLASDNLYSYNTSDKSIQTYDKINGLNDTKICKIGYNKSTKKIVIIYDNENIDLLDLSGNVTNISDYYNSSITYDKTINSIFQYGNYTYLCSGFGIIKLNVKNAEISDTYNLGFNVNWGEIKDNHIYAYSTSKGEYSAILTDNLLDKNNWTRVGDYVEESVENIDSLKTFASTLNPGGPKCDYFGFMKYYNGSLYTCGGGYRGINELDRDGVIQVYKDGEWQIYSDSIEEKAGHAYKDVTSLAIDPNNDQHVFAGSRTGVYEFLNGNYVRDYNYNNSELASAFKTNKNYVLTLSVEYDSDGNLWVLNSLNQEEKSILEYTSDGQWNSFHKSTLIDNEGVVFQRLEDLTTDSRDLTWFVNDFYVSPAICCYQKSTDALNVLSSFVNEDGASLTPTYIHGVAEDNDNNMWFGTNIGPLMIKAADVTSSDPVFQQIKVPRNDGTNLADYLLSGVDISCIAIDGAGRKWFGSNGNGVYLISEDNYTQIHHFTTLNSSLLSDDIESIAINQSSGEVFFGTDKGLCSYMSDATEPVTEMNKDVTYAYPNPVRPGYNGNITVVGLSYDADVKIVTSNGALVAQGRSNGGTFVWDGNDLNGKRVASGVYMVETATSTGEKGTVCKIAVVN